MRWPSRTAAQVSSQEVSIASSRPGLIQALSFQPPSVQPHDQRVLAVVVVVARTDAGRAKPEALIHADRAVIGDPHLQSEREGAPRLLDQAPHQQPGDPGAAAL